MKCINPTLVRNDDKGKRIFRSYDICSKKKHTYHHFLQNPTLVLDCGRCIICRKKKAFELACRCVLHSSLYKDNCFLTLTYDEKRPGYDNRFQYKDIQDFKKRLRSYCSRTLKKKIEIFNVHEYGRNGKKHWHLIVFNHDFADKHIHTRKNSNILYSSDKLHELWPHGFNTIGDVTTASSMYQAQYMEKDFKHGNSTSEKKSHSKHSGLGRPYFERHYEQILRLGYIPIDGKKLPLPRYFEKLAKKHYAHFYEPDLFRTFPHRQAAFRPFLRETPNKRIADLYVYYRSLKQSKILDLEKEWSDIISQYLTTEKLPDFILSGQNTLYDLSKKNFKENF